ncbi:SP family arabinose:H+ symporter-like MFS transporter [Chitinophaga polysaccharea]|uniref:SP family arabinose:H+ symporter-like MFS transporter n=1 Tax=Chitinophaga polysaccharea TaxID=1293035 RepID=A0A561PPG9_9BACT|nr:sugar porter family MFS transporter [Chitinophaga polysaccharea]TWF39993.1 SP family arabinose:H+ symporter-like MFS transporter [Chitinophaga polysaccharea]
MTQAKNSRFIVFITLIAALGGFLFGFDMAVVSGIIEPVKLQYGLSSSQEGLFVSCALLGCIGGVAFSGYLSDKIGRRKVLFIAAFLFLISAVGFAFSKDYAVLIFFRIMAGMAVGVASNVSPLYISEIAPGHKRGALVTFYQLAITIGVLCAYLSNLFLQRNAAAHTGAGEGLLHWLFIENVWRGMFLVAVIPATAFALLLLIVPESPRWLVQYGRTEEAYAVLLKTTGEQEAAVELKAILEVASQKQGGFSELLRLPLSKLLALATILTALSQLSGINGIIFYGPTIMKSAGIVTSDALFYQVILGLANTVFTVVAILKVDSWGRRPLYLYGSLFAALALLLTGFCFLNGVTGWLMLGAIILFLLFFALSLGPLKFVISTEIFPTHIRGTAVSVCIMTMWVSDWFVNLLFPVMRDGLGIAVTFFIFSFFCLLSFFYAKSKLMETKGKSLEEIEKMLV